MPAHEHEDTITFLYVLDRLQVIHCSSPIKSRFTFTCLSSRALVVQSFQVRVEDLEFRSSVRLINLKLYTSSFVDSEFPTPQSPNLGV